MIKQLVKLLKEQEDNLVWDLIGHLLFPYLTINYSVVSNFMGLDVSRGFLFLPFEILEEYLIEPFDNPEKYYYVTKAVDEIAYFICHPDFEKSKLSEVYFLSKEHYSKDMEFRKPGEYMKIPVSIIINYVDTLLNGYNEVIKPE